MSNKVKEEEEEESFWNRLPVTTGRTLVFVKVSGPEHEKKHNHLHKWTQSRQQQPHTVASCVTDSPSVINELGDKVKMSVTCVQSQV